MLFLFAFLLFCACMHQLLFDLVWFVMWTPVLLSFIELFVEGDRGGEEKEANTHRKKQTAVLISHHLIFVLRSPMSTVVVASAFFLASAFVTAAWRRVNANRREASANQTFAHLHSMIVGEAPIEAKEERNEQVA
jgi:hypothetical protein